MLYLREDAIADPVDRFVFQELTGSNLAENMRRIAAAQHRALTW